MFPLAVFQGSQVWEAVMKTPLDSSSEAQLGARGSFCCDGSHKVRACSGE